MVKRRTYSAVNQAPSRLIRHEARSRPGADDYLCQERISAQLNASWHLRVLAATAAASGRVGGLAALVIAAGEAPDPQWWSRWQACTQCDATP